MTDAAPAPGLDSRSVTGFLLWHGRRGGAKEWPAACSPPGSPGGEPRRVGEETPRKESGAMAAFGGTVTAVPMSVEMESPRRPLDGGAPPLAIDPGGPP